MTSLRTRGPETFPFRVQRVEQRADGMHAVSGLAVTWERNLGRVRFDRAAFDDGLDARVREGRVKFRWQHQEPFGVVRKARIDDRGLWIEAEFPETPENLHRLTLMQSGVVDRLSIGYAAPDDAVEETDDEAVIHRATLYEVSATDIPLDEGTEITRVLSRIAETLDPPRRRQSVVAYQDLPLADRERPWDAAEAETRVRAWAGAEDAPNERYRRAFVWFDADAPDQFGSYKLQIADVVDDTLTAVPRAVFAAAAAVQGARGGVDIPEDDLPGVRDHLARYYAKLDATPPWEEQAVTPTGEQAADAGQELTPDDRILIEQAVTLLQRVLGGTDDEEPTGEPEEQAETPATTGEQGATLDALMTLTFQTIQRDMAQLAQTRREA